MYALGFCLKYQISKILKHFEILNCKDDCFNVLNFIQKLKYLKQF